ncbi:MAG: thioredoxin-like domain-containing protein [Phycisphaeraceae bacterium]
MKRLMQVGVGGVLAAVVAVPVLYGAGGLLDQDERRLEGAKARHAEQIETASQAYLAAVERANATLERNYQRTIETYERRDDSETVAALKAELEALLAQGHVPTAPAPGAAEPGHVALIEAIGPTLVDANGNTGSSDILADKEYVLLYFSASWCGPCRAFTPSLVTFHNQNADEGNFEIVLVSSDRSAGAMSDYMSADNMGFPAVPFDRIAASQLKNTYGGRGIPNLVIVDREGDVVSGSYVDGRYVGPRKVLADMQALLQ